VAGSTHEIRAFTPLGLETKVGSIGDRIVPLGESGRSSIGKGGAGVGGGVMWKADISKVVASIYVG
jgi:hypothetical protein